MEDSVLEDALILTHAWEKIFSFLMLAFQLLQTNQLHFILIAFRLIRRPPYLN